LIFFRRWSLGLVIFTMLLSGCTADTSGRDEDGFVPHLLAKLNVDYHNQDIGLFSADITLKGQSVTPDQVVFEVWREDKPENRVFIDGAAQEEGTYLAKYPISELGIYIVRCSIVYGDLEVMPAKAFAVGQDNVSKLAERQYNDNNSVKPEINHHHH